MATKKPKMTVRAQIEQLIQTKMEEAVRDLPNQVESAISQAIYSLLGISRNGEIDHCNRRWNLFSEILKAEAVKECSEIISKLRVKFDFDQFKAAFQKEYVSHLRCQLKYEAERQAKGIAKATVEKYLNELVPKKVESFL